MKPGAVQFASMLIVESKQDVESVSRQLGHANSTITLSTYPHQSNEHATSTSSETQ